MTRPMPSTPAYTRRNRLRLAGLALLTSSALTGCGAGFDAQTNQVDIPADGIPAQAGSIKILNALVVSDGDGGVVSLTVANTATAGPAGTVPEDQTISLEGISAGDAVAELTGETEVDASTSLRVGSEDAAAVFRAGDFEPGATVPLTVSLSSASGTLQEITLPAVPVVPPTGYYATYTPTPGG